MSETFNPENRSLSQWLKFLEEIDPNHIELGLERIKKVALKLNLSKIASKTIEVAGTNGKGSTAAFIAGALNFSGIKAGLYTSPHLHNFTERVNIGGKEVSSGLLCEAFCAVYKAASSCQVKLTYFEYTTLAAFYCFKAQKVDVAVLEIGLGGRLDAVNVIDADIAVITSIGLDHTAILGNTIEKIAYEKAGIIKNHAMVVVDKVSPDALMVILEKAASCNARVLCEGSDFKTSFTKDGFDFHFKDVTTHWSLPKIPYICIAGVFCVLQLLKDAGFAITDKALVQALNEVALPGRMQKVHERPDIYFDVAHNPPAALHLKQNILRFKENSGELIAVVGMLKDKDIESVLHILKDSFNRWFVASLPGARGENAARLKDNLIKELGKNAVSCNRIKDYATVEEALSAAVSSATSQDTIIVFGSFVTVCAADECIAKIIKSKE